MYIILMTTKFEIKEKDKKGKIKIIEFYSCTHLSLYKLWKKSLACAIPVNYKHMSQQSHMAPSLSTTSAGGALEQGCYPDKVS